MKKMNKKIMFILFKRNFSTSKISYNNKDCLALVNYTNKIFFKPILSIEDKLLAPVILNDNLLSVAQDIQYILSKLANASLVKLWLTNKFEQDKIIINAKINKEADNLLNKIEKIENKITENSSYLVNSSDFMTEVDEYFSKIKYFYSDIEQDELYYGDTINLFSFNDVKTGLNKILKKETTSNSLYACCYIITFDNKFYYYIGSTTNIKKRFNLHTDNINNFYIVEKNKLNKFFIHFLDSEISFPIKQKENLKNSQNIINFDINVVYLSTNYLNKFKQIYPNYKLNKEEKLLLNIISDFIIKTLEESLIIKFQPKLNIAKKVNFKYSKFIEENKNNSPFTNKITSQRRNFSTSKIYYNNKNCAVLEKYKNEIFLKPILNTENELLAPIIINENIINQIEKIKFVLSRVSDSNLVKMWLKSELEQDKIIINALKNNDTDELLKEIKEIIPFEIEEPEMNDEFNNYYSWPTIFINDIERNKLHYKNNKGLFKYIDWEVEEFLNGVTKKNSLHTCCYIIIFDNKYYNYIGSTTQIKNRLRTHFRNIKNFIEGKKSDSNQMFKYFLESEIHYLYNEEKGEKILYYDIKIVYLCSNYLNKFLKTYSDYKLNKGEWILLFSITDFIIKTLEQSLITEFQPKLNMVNDVLYQYFDWDDKYLQIYNESDKTIKYFKSKSKKYSIYVQSEEIIYDTKSYISRLKIKLGFKPKIIKKIQKDLFVRTSILHDLCKRYKLNKNEVLSNLNYWHTYEGSVLVNPLKIIEIK